MDKHDYAFIVVIAMAIITSLLAVAALVLALKPLSA